MSSVSIEYPPEILSALNQDAVEFQREAQLLLAVKLYETGRLSTGLAARLAGVPRTAFFQVLGEYGLSPFDDAAEALGEDLAHGRRARRQ